jgi:hypothetical protein
LKRTIVFGFSRSFNNLFQQQQQTKHDTKAFENEDKVRFTPFVVLSSGLVYVEMSILPLLHLMRPRALAALEILLMPLSEVTVETARAPAVAHSGSTAPN